jgi:hypothetical protein
MRETYPSHLKAPTVGTFFLKRNRLYRNSPRLLPYFAHQSRITPSIMIPATAIQQLLMNKQQFQQQLVWGLQTQQWQ